MTDGERLMRSGVSSQLAPFAAEYGLHAFARRQAGLICCVLVLVLGVVGLIGRMPFAGDRVLKRFQDLVARFMPFDLVIDEETAWGEPARVSKTSVCGSWRRATGRCAWSWRRRRRTPPSAG